MLHLSVEALKILIYLQEDLLKEASKSKFLMSICLRSKDFRVHIQVKQMDSSHRFQIMIVIITAIFFIIIIYLFLVEVEMITVSKKLIQILSHITTTLLLPMRVPLALNRTTLVHVKRLDVMNNITYNNDNIHLLNVEYNINSYSNNYNIANKFRPNFRRHRR